MQQTYRLIPVADHPLFPGSTAGVSVTYDQYKELKNIETVFASIVKNDDLLRESQDLVQVLQKGQQPRGLPQIKSIDDIYRIGVLCQAQV